MPGMSGSGNMMPQSRMTMRPSTSTQAQLRPISPESAEEDDPDGLWLASVSQAGRP